MDTATLIGKTLYTPCVEEYLEDSRVRALEVVKYLPRLRKVVVRPAGVKRGHRWETPLDGLYETEAEAFRAMATQVEPYLREMEERARKVRELQLQWSRKV